MKLPAALYVLAIATGVIALPAQEDQGMEVRAASNAAVVERSTGSTGHEHSRAVEVQSRGETMTEELVVVINDPDSPTKKKLKERINTTSANNVGYGKAIAAAVDAAYSQAKQLSDWDEARQTFTKGVVERMAANNPDYSRAKAAVCYNMGYRIRDTTNYYGLRSISFSSGVLKTNYDCFYLGNDNAFWYDGDGGFENLAMNYPTDSCTWDRGVALTCM